MSHVLLLAFFRSFETSPHLAVGQKEGLFVLTPSRNFHPFAGYSAVSYPGGGDIQGAQEREVTQMFWGMVRNHEASRFLYPFKNGTN